MRLTAKALIATRCADSLSLQTFLGLGPTDDTPHHTSLSVIRERLPHAVHQGVFTWVLTLAREKRLLSGKTLGVDSTTLEANAAMKAIVRKDSGDDWRAYLAGLMREAGQLGPEETPSAEDLQRFDRRRKDKSASNEDWESPSDPDSRIARLKDGTTHLAYKTEHAADRRGRLVPSDIGWRSSDADPA